MKGPPGTKAVKAQSVPAQRAAIDVPVAIRGGSAGFSVLLIGGLLTPMVAMISPAVGSAWLVLTAVVAFIVAARRTGTAARPAVHGVIAAVFAYVLVLPLLLPFAAGRNLPQILLTFATAIIVGAATGWLQHWRTSKR